MDGMRNLRRLAGGAVLAVALSACAHTAEERQLDNMRAQIDELQSDRDRIDRPPVDSEVSGTPADPGKSHIEEGSAAAPLSSDDDRPPGFAPRSEVVRVGSSSADMADAPDTEDPTPRPTLRLVGRGAADSDGSTRGGQRAGSLDPEAKRAYDAALSLFKGRQYAAANERLAAFLVKWPDHPYADRAMFWRGECFLAQGNCERASEQLEGLLARFPASSKAPDALLELGTCHEKAGDSAAATECFDRLTQQYPGSDAARRIPRSSAPAAARSGTVPEEHR